MDYATNVINSWSNTYWADSDGVNGLVVCSKRQQIGMAIGVSLGCIVLLGVIAVPVVYMRRQWARAEENKLRLTARMSGLDESEVRSEVGTRHR